jgi:hypothetical protein
MEGEPEQAVVVVPAEPGPVRALPGRRRERDDVDEVVDELLGVVDDRPPGPVDAALVAGGAGLAAWAGVAGGPSWALVGGGVLAVLGVALPATWAWRRMSEHRLRRRQGRALAGGLPLAVDGPEVQALLAAHDRVMRGARSPRIRSGAHAAVIEVAALLGGAPAHDDASRTFVRDRAEAVTALAAALEAVPATRRAHLLEARREVAGVGGSDALAEVQGLVREVDVGGDPA